MTLGYKDKVIKPDFSYKSYISKRCIKFYPLHWLCILVVIPLVLIYNAELKQLFILFINGFLLQTWIPIKEYYFSYNWVSWYLADTMFFAVLFPFLFKWIIMSSKIGKILIASAMAVVYVIVAIMLPVEKYHAILYISPYMRLTDFVLGIYLALLYYKLREQPLKWWQGSVVGQLIVFVLIVLLVAESCFLPESARMVAPVYWIIVATIILTTSLIKRSGWGLILENRYLLRFGELSFIFFMIHQLVLRYTTLVFEKILHYENTIVYIILTLGLTILLSLIIEKYILKPITQWLTKEIQPSTTVRS